MPPPPTPPTEYTLPAHCCKANVSPQCTHCDYDPKAKPLHIIIIQSWKQISISSRFVWNVGFSSNLMTSFCWPYCYTACCRHCSISVTPITIAFLDCTVYLHHSLPSNLQLPKMRCNHVVIAFYLHAILHNTDLRKFTGVS